ncbi:hypothetical protein ONZ45_g14711 [Pleurotus djamor]|nr:hypothetical protein ONZ45_g14711 [Pleurotus djamor]
MRGKEFDPSNLPRRPPVMDSLYKASMWWSLSITLCFALWSIMLVWLTEEPYKQTFLDKIVLFFMTTQITGAIVHRLILSFERSSTARDKWALVSSRIASFAGTIKWTSLPPSTREGFVAGLEELSVAFGLYDNPELLVLENDIDAEDTEDALVHAPDQFVDEDLPSKSPNLNTVLERSVSSLRSFSLDLYSKLRGKPKPTKSWLQIFLDLDRMVDEAATNVIGDVTRALLRSRLDDIAENYHAILDLHPFE